MIKYLLMTLLFLIPITSVSQNVKTFIPERAFTYLPILKNEVDKYFSDLTYKEYFGGLAEQESCISLKHSRCWSPTSQLLTKRERGAGLFQLTKAFRTDGSIRFDSLSDMRKAHYSELKELSWNNILQRPDLQIRAMLLMSKDNWRALHMVESELERLKMTDAAYNSGLGSVKKRRRVCGLRANCNPQIWFDNLEDTVVLSTKPIYGNRSAHFINNEHVENIFNLRMGKYKPHLR